MPAPAFRSSGDLAADRRYVYAMDLLAEGDAVAAADLLEQTLELVPDWAAGWFALAVAREACSDTEAAIVALRRCAECDPADALGAHLHLARLGAAAPPDAPPRAYVRDLFDAYAGTFEQALVGSLGYRAPALIVAALAAMDPARRYSHALDLGCGTGLMAEALAGRVDAIDGVDLSSAMVEIARAKRLYSRLAVGDVIDDLNDQPKGTYDLVTAADVLCYLGDLAPVVTAVARVLRGAGVLAFTVEAASAGDFTLRDSLRYCHGAGYVRRVADMAGLRVAALTSADLRNDRGMPVAGLVGVFTQP